MKVVIPGGTGQLGRVLVRALLAAGHEVVVLSRGGRSAARLVRWDGQNLGPWTAELEGADAVINLAGRSVNCRYHKHNLAAMMQSRIRSARVVGQAIAAASAPPRVWLQASTATLYAHRLDGPPHDEIDHEIGGMEPDVPLYWTYSTDIAQSWERVAAEQPTPATRRVYMRTSYAMSADDGGIFDWLYWLARVGLGGPIVGGRQYVSWIHEQDLAAAVLLLIARDDLSGPFNLAAPHPLPQAELMATLRRLAGRRFGLSINAWMAEVGAWLLKTDTELVIKSRKVVSRRLPEAGFTFAHPTWDTAAAELLSRWPITLAD